MEVVLEISFFTLSNANIQFTERKLVWRTYSAAKALPTTQRVEIIDKKKFAATVWNEEDKTFVVHMAAFSMDFNIHASQWAQISLLDIEEVTIPSEYIAYTDVFLPNSAVELPKHTNINNYLINLIDDK